MPKRRSHQAAGAGFSKHPHDSRAAVTIQHAWRKQFRNTAVKNYVRLQADDVIGTTSTLAKSIRSLLDYLASVCKCLQVLAVY